MIVTSHTESIRSRPAIFAKETEIVAARHVAKQPVRWGSAPQLGVVRGLGTLARGATLGKYLPARRLVNVELAVLLPEPLTRPEDETGNGDVTEPRRRKAARQTGPKKTKRRRQ